MYVCVHVCMDGWMYVYIYVMQCVHVCNVWMYEIYVCMYGWMYVCMYVMYVCNACNACMYVSYSMSCM